MESISQPLPGFYSSFPEVSNAISHILLPVPDGEAAALSAGTKVNLHQGHSGFHMAD